MLKETFVELATRHSDNRLLINKLWDEIRAMYSHKSRHYHTLSHLDNLLSLLVAIKSEIEDWDAVLFAMYYHDIVYKSTSDKNEEKSADLAKLRLTELSFAPHRIVKCLRMILATKGHTPANDNDTDYFTDADLSILGQSRDAYSQYATGVRQEYAIYPALIYNPGRKKVLNHFLEMNRIFKTKHFFDKFEKQARENLINELKTL